MQINIEKTCKEINNCKKEFYFYNRARDGFSDILNKLKNKYSEYTLLIPAFIGYSPNEGSGVFDPIMENHINYEFYMLDEKLNINIEDYKQKINSITNKVVLLIIDYFGFLDKKYDYIIDLAIEKEAIIIEDCAHALYTDFVDHKCSEKCDFVLYSLHKMLPYKNGGMVKINNSRYNGILENNNYYELHPFDYDLYKISQKRKKNMQTIENMLKTCNGITMIRKDKEYKTETPQTYPIIIERQDKNKMYHILNDQGYGVTSLYHTMIEPLQKNRISTEISKKILNLPVHQDAEEEQIRIMCEKIIELCED